MSESLGVTQPCKFQQSITTIGSQNLLRFGQGCRLWNWTIVQVARRHFRRPTSLHWDSVRTRDLELSNCRVTLNYFIPPLSRDKSWDWIVLLSWHAHSPNCGFVRCLRCASTTNTRQMTRRCAPRMLFNSKLLTAPSAPNMLRLVYCSYNTSLSNKTLLDCSQLTMFRLFITLGWFIEVTIGRWYNSK